jgi:hypothetical protein
MTLTIDLTPEEEARLNAAADSESLEPAALIREWINSCRGAMRERMAFVKMTLTHFRKKRWRLIRRCLTRSSRPG